MPLKDNRLQDVIPDITTSDNHNELSDDGGTTTNEPWDLIRIQTEGAVTSAAPFASLSQACADKGTYPSMGK